MRSNVSLHVPSERSIAAGLVVASLILTPSLVRGAEVEVQELRTQKVGETTYFEVTLTTPEDMRQSTRYDGTGSLETRRRAVASLPRLVPQDRNSASVCYFHPRSTERIYEPSLTFLGKTCGKEAAAVCFYYPTGTKSATVDGSLMQSYVQAPIWREAKFTIDFSKARRLVSPPRLQDRPKLIADDDLERRWALAQTKQFEVWRLQSPGFGFFAFARAATARKYRVRMFNMEPPPPADPEGDYKYIYELITGGSTLADSLAQNRMSSETPTKSEWREVDIGKLEGIALPEHPWATMMGGKESQVESLSNWIPDDNYYAVARGIRAYQNLAELLDRWGGNVLHAYEQVSRDERIRARYEKQLCLPADRLAEKCGDSTIRAIAITGSDLYWREGSDLSVLFDLKDKKRFMESAEIFLQEARKEYGKQMVESTSEYKDVRIESFATPLREISLHRVVVEEIVIYSNSLAGLHRILDARNSPDHALAKAQDFQYMRLIYRYTDKDEDGFAFLSDAFIRRLLSPASKIKEQRRLKALASLSLVHHAALFHAWETGRLPASQDELLTASALNRSVLLDPEGEEVKWDASRQQAVSKQYGTRSFLTPLVELPIDRVTMSEEIDYRNFARAYKNLWQRFLDPAGLRFTTRGRRLRVETHILPVVRTSGYDTLRRITGGKSITFDMSRISPSTVVQLLTAFNANEISKKDGKQGESWALVTLDDSKKFQELLKLWVNRSFELGDARNKSLEEIIHVAQRLPLTVGLHYAGDADGKRSQEIVESYRSLLVEGIDKRIDETYRGITISTSASKLLGFDLKVYSARIENAYYLSLRRDSLFRSIDQSILRREKQVKEQPTETATSLYFAPQSLLQSASAVFGYLEWESHRRALESGATWHALYRSGLLATNANGITQQTTALRYLGYIPVSPDGSAYRYDTVRDEATNERHGSYGRPRLGSGLDKRSAGKQLFDSLRTVRVDLSFREDGVQTALTFDLKSDRDMTLLREPAYLEIIKRGGTVRKLESADGRTLILVDLSHTNTTDDDLVNLTKIKGLHTLRLDDTSVTDTGLKHLRSASELRELYVDTPGVHDAGAASLLDRKQIRLHRRADRERALEIIRAVGGDLQDAHLNLKDGRITNDLLTCLCHFPEVESLDLAGTSVSDAGLKHLYTLKKLRLVNLYDTCVTDRGVAALDKALPNLLTINRLPDLETRQRRLARAIWPLHGRLEIKKLPSGKPRIIAYFYASNISSKQLAEVEGFEIVHELSLAGLRQIDDEVIGLLKNATQLQSLNLRRTSVTGKGLKSIGKLKEIQKLMLADTRLVNSELVHLKDLKSLEQLDIGINSIDDEGVAHLKGLTNLRELRLDSTRVSDKSFEVLSGLKGLKKLDLRQTRFTSEGIEALRKALPDADIRSR